MLPNQIKVKAPAGNGGRQKITGQVDRSAFSLADNAPDLVTVSALLKARQCTPGCLCATAPKKRCKCACGGSLHGALGSVHLIVGEATK